MTTTPIEIAYGDAPEQVLDLHLAPDAATAPIVIYAHGGGFQRGDKTDHGPRLSMLASLGVNVASINYRLAPAHRHPAQVDDVRTAVAALRTRIAGEHGLDGTAIGAIGASAGGFLVSSAALGRSDAASAIQAASVWFASSDFLESARRSPLEERISPITYERVLLGDDAGPAEFAAASPARWNLSDAPPMLLVTGDSDKIVAPVQSAILHDALARAGRDSTLVRLAGVGHEDTAFDEAPLLGIVAAWFRGKLGGAK